MNNKWTRKFLGTILKALFFRVPYVRYSAQTVYKSLQACNYLYDATDDIKWQHQATKLIRLVSKIQQKNGGFDVGYNYQFGSTNYHKKGQALSCETTALMVVKMTDTFSNLNLEKETILEKGLNWILFNVVSLSNEKCAIPYCPDVTKEISIINGTSFTCSALALNDNSVITHDIYLKMINYLYYSLISVEGFRGKCWPYFDISTNASLATEIKIDYYHLAQQIEVHAIAQQYNPNDLQLKLIEETSEFLISIFEKERDIIPYDNLNIFGGYIHSWGVSSIIPAMIEVSKLFSNNKKYLDLAHFTMNWLIDHAWNGEFFYDILTKQGKPLSTDYMIRSDAWCLQACAAYTKEFGKGEWFDIAERCYERISLKNFSGKEKHGKITIQVYLEKFQIRH